MTEQEFKDLQPGDLICNKDNTIWGKVLEIKEIVYFVAIKKRLVRIAWRADFELFHNEDDASLYSMESIMGYEKHK